MADSGARGGIEQIRQLAGMRGLMAKPSGEIIETPIKANFREGLTVLEYFSSTHGARKGLADTALKTADSRLSHPQAGRHLPEHGHHHARLRHDEGHDPRGRVPRREGRSRPGGRHSRPRQPRRTSSTRSPTKSIVREDELITVDIARKIEEMGLEKIQVRSPMTCEADLGMCRLCYGMDLSTGALVEEGLAVGIIAAQSIGEPGTQLTMRTFHIGGVGVEGRRRKRTASQEGGPRAASPASAASSTPKARTSCSAATAKSPSSTRRNANSKSTTIPNGAVLLVAEERGGRSQARCSASGIRTRCRFSREVGGKVRFEDLRRRPVDPLGDGRQRQHPPHGHRAQGRPAPADHHRRRHRQDSRLLLPPGTGEHRSPGRRSRSRPVRCSPRTRAKRTGTQDITGGLPRVTELFEARKPKDPAIIAEIDGEVELVAEKKRGKRVIIVKGADGTEVEHIIPHGKHLLVHAGDRVKAGDALVRGPLVPHDILRVSGEEAVQQYLLHEIQNVYRVAARGNRRQAHRNRRRADAPQGPRRRRRRHRPAARACVIDKFEFRKVNQKLQQCVAHHRSGRYRVP